MISCSYLLFVIGEQYCLANSKKKKEQLKYLRSETYLFLFRWYCRNMNRSKAEQLLRSEVSVCTCFVGLVPAQNQLK